MAEKCGIRKNSPFNQYSVLFHQWKNLGYIDDDKKFPKILVTICRHVDVFGFTTCLDNHQA